MKKVKKLISTFLTVIMVLCVLTVAPFSADAITNQQGADWALSRVGAWIDTDGYYGAQCKDFVNAYTQENWGITFPGNACDLIYANMPNGWQKIQNYDAFIPKPGDIAVWGGWGSNPYGHTAVIISANYYTFDSVDQNWVNSSSNGSAAAYVTHNYTSPKFWGVIRPPFSSPVPNVTNPWITTNKNILVKGDTVTFSLGADNATNYTIGIDKDGSRLITQEVNTNPSFRLDEPGEYSAYVTCYNSSSYTDSGRVYFTVLDTANLGDSFYGVILNKKCWKPIGITDNRNVEIQTETGIASQFWKFERQTDNSYKIMNTKNGECLDLENFNTENGHNIQICPDNNSAAQRWYLVPCNGGYCFVTKCGLTKVMDLEENNTADGTNISIYGRNNSDAQIFSVYATEEVQLKGTELSVSSNGKTFNWTHTYGESGYRLKIWNGVLFDGDAYYTDWNISPNTLSTTVDLPAGYYEAYIDTVNHFECETSNTIKFTVKPEVDISADSNTGAVKIKWENTLKANSYSINIFNANTDELVFSKDNLENDSYSLNLEFGHYYLTVISDNNISSIKHYFSVGNNTIKIKIGDVNLDGNIDDNDVNMIMENISKGIKINKQIADINRDGRVNMIDVFILKRYIEGKEIEYETYEIEISAILGDTNLDGILNITDATSIQKYLANLISFSEGINSNADIDKNSNVDIKDATAIQRFLAK